MFDNLFKPALFLFRKEKVQGAQKENDRAIARRWH